MVTLEPAAECAARGAARASSYSAARPRRRDKPAGSYSLPQLGDHSSSRLTDNGLLRVEHPAEETVWLLTRDARSGNASKLGASTIAARCRPVAALSRRPACQCLK